VTPVNLGYRDFLDIALGGTVLGTGGGGSYETAEHLAKTHLRRKSAKLVSFGDVASRARIVSIAGMGSPEAMLKNPFTTEALHAFDALTRDFGDDAKYVIPIETSGFNFLTPMTVATSRPVRVIDGDAAGRAIPQLNMTLFYASGISLAPLALADAEGRSVTIHGSDYALSEKAAISALESFGWSAGLACYPMAGSVARRASVPGTISLARVVGISLRLALEAGKDPLAAVLDVVGGKELLRGTVDRFDSETVGSYKFGTLEVRGKEGDLGHTARVKSMNENMIAWKDDRLAAVAPDRICFLTPDGRPVTNADIAPGDELAIFAIEAQSPWKSKKTRGLFASTLAAMGYEGPYIPIRNLPHGG
jgi:DUF917 family protein